MEEPTVEEFTVGTRVASLTRSTVEAGSTNRVAEERPTGIRATFSGLMNKSCALDCAPEFGIGSEPSFRALVNTLPSSNKRPEVFKLELCDTPVGADP